MGVGGGRGPTGSRGNGHKREPADRAAGAERRDTRGRGSHTHARTQESPEEGRWWLRDARSPVLAMTPAVCTPGTWGVVPWVRGQAEVGPASHLDIQLPANTNTSLWGSLGDQL